MSSSQVSSSPKSTSSRKSDQFVPSYSSSGDLNANATNTTIANSSSSSNKNNNNLKSTTTSSTNTIKSAGGIKISENNEIEASFTGRSNKPTSNIADKEIIKSSPLLSSTPPTVSKVLIRSYPYLILLDKILGVLTWSSEDSTTSFLLCLSVSIFILYFENIVVYFGHILCVGLLAIYSNLNAQLVNEEKQYPTLDDIVHRLGSVSMKFEMMLNPLTNLNLTSYDLKRLLFTTIFLSPAYILISYFLISPKIMILISVLFVLTYNSNWSRVTRRILWKSKTFRLICFYITGLDFGHQHGNKDSLFKIAMNKTNQKLKEVTSSSVSSTSNKITGPVRFTYVLYENQRRWLGVGWTPNLLSYERTPWTDEFLNESESTETFELPQLQDENSGSMYWRWVDKTWRLDLSNDGALQLPSNKSKTLADPKPDDGFIYYDNTWKTPSTEDTFSKYTRRRRWIRTAELVSTNDLSLSPTTSHVDIGDFSASTSTIEQQQSSSDNNVYNNSNSNAPGLGISKSSTVSLDVQNITATGDITASGIEKHPISATSTSSIPGRTLKQDKISKRRKSLRFDDEPSVITNNNANAKARKSSFSKENESSENEKIDFDNGSDDVEIKVEDSNYGNIKVE